MAEIPGTPNPETSAAQNIHDTAARAAEVFGALVETMALLRAPGGCPWDAEQTHVSLIRYLVEETYEVVEAVETGGEPNMPLLCEELGDVLLQVVFHSDIAAANPQGFDIVQVVEGLVQKLRSRHPDVFEAGSGGSSEAPRTAAEQQAVDRIHRLGQERDVHVYRLVAEGTIEEKVMDLKASKAALFDAVVNDGSFASSRVDAEQIRELFTPTDS